MSDRIRSIEVFPLQIPRETPYLGPLEAGVVPSPRGYFVRPGNQTLYSIHDHSLLVKVTSEGGVVGWGESFGVVAPQVAATIIDELFAPLVIGRDPHDVVAISEDLYNGMRVRGFFGGFYVDAIAGVDMAIWDLRGKLTGLPVCKLLGAQRHSRLPVYVSGLPRATLPERAALARDWIDKGFGAVKFAAAVAHEGEVAEIQAIREAVGPGPKILADLHWRYTDQEAIQLITAMEPYGLYVAEAPVQSEDLEGQARVAAAVKTPIAIGEELRTVYEYRPRFVHRCMSIIQPEMAHMGITFFWQVCQMAQAFHCRVMPHATIGIGIAQAASMHVSAALQNFVMHEYQHSIFDRNLRFVTGTMRCQAGYFYLPEGPGLGVAPTDEVLQYVMGE
ncbi:mandelate racemase/muconate lactonizing enzyme family protein [Litorilinea aerophila]|uniref:Mandelate racemase/muconate lactonizing enzyme family protein n=1 Tax=Litorilinea aerophila TaxID=1204385 RepID=A0A540VC07_9CHLR|nr:mandelate racemase/muconate lactonizing enzyme family protein [Litorilinea aerophila]MCC9077995.1 mandelate racemase/muconate lactonizing enzyme family protein [Litorilinea aerophila]OUC08610.1 enolase [Litorilinea aerophila]